MELANHNVVKGEALTSIAARYRTTVDKLQRLNPFIQNVNHVQAGWNLSVPALSSSSGTSAASNDPQRATPEPASNESSSTPTAFGEEPSVPDSCSAPGEDALPPCATTYATAIYATEEQAFWLLPEKLSETIQEALQELADSISPEKSPEDRKRGLDEMGLLEYFMEPKLTNFLEGEDLERAQAIEAEVPDIANRSRAWQQLAEERGLPASPFSRPPMGNPFTEEGRAAARHLEQALAEVRQAAARLDVLHSEWQQLEAKGLIQAKKEEYT
ncbi:MAG: LysM peptidoglycan-binding domain-containing protein [Pseudomonas sp.]|nr:LysM peptidoglycan-binding domain-containing protein [Pseudomonas sp.]